ncbi:MAG TPA: polyprenyl synthetase family protein [Candidatus Cloacimonadota bacterium]|nr:polyprenyl synthetase family protein [Candidatus Cloacimonadales bacterium]HPY96836.1 polyprenyl synthetase family protein [Candidatus Cloacimonadota bacterium]HQB40127.1 polyprenyl synthetase family protein [Candidatus Cloacimonadota bacterium]
MILPKYFDDRAKMLDVVLDQYLTPETEEPKDLYAAMRYSVFSGGKRLRPILFFATYEMLVKKATEQQMEQASLIAAALEMVHTASLIHDDLPSVDNSDERRGKESCHVKFGAATAILAGDALLTKAFEMITKLEDPRKAVHCIRVLCNLVSTQGMIGGQTVDIISSSKQNIPITVIKYVHLKKTGALLEAASHLACVMADADENTTNNMVNYAQNLGLAYQIIDDILDDIGDFEMLGKEPYEDARNFKSTYPSILGLDKARQTAEKLISDSSKLIKNLPNNHILIEFVKMIKDRLP